MSSPTFESYSQNGEDVVLWRALRGVTRGRYVDVGANHPRYFSISMAFYAKGWSGITVEPDPEFAQLQREERPRDIQVEAAATAKEGDTVTLHVVDSTGLSTLDRTFAARHAASGYETHDLTVPTRRIDAVLEEVGWAGRDIHFMCVDTEGSEHDVIEGIDLTVWRPWILVIEATAPLSTESTRASWEPIVAAAGYRFCLFDGLSCFYVADERRAELGAALSYPACPHDDYSTLEYRERTSRLEAIPALMSEVTRWRAQAMTRWATAVARLTEVNDLRAELEALQRRYVEVDQRHQELTRNAAGLHQQIAEFYASTSWRVTRPLRAVTGLFGSSRRSS